MTAPALQPLEALVAPQELPPSDFTPGIAPIVLDRADILRQIEALQNKLDGCKPFIVSVGGALKLYQGKEIVVQTTGPDRAQRMCDYLNANLPNGMTVEWRVIPSQPLNPS